MIRQISSLNGMDIPPHPQLSRIWSLYQAYGASYDFCRFYLAQDGTGTPCAVFCMLDDGITLYGWRSGADEELADFLVMYPLRAGASICSETLPSLLESSDSLFHGRMRRGNILVKTVEGPGRRRPSMPDFRRVYRIWEQAFPGYFPPAGFDRWYRDASHRIRHRAQDIILLENKAAGAVSYGDGMYTVISQAAVEPAHRGKGIGSRLLSVMEQTALGVCQSGQYQMTTDFCKAAVYSKNEKTDRFYEKNGYTRLGTWTEMFPLVERK